MSLSILSIAARVWASLSSTDIVTGSKIREVAMSSFKETGDKGVVNSGEIGSRDVLETIGPWHGRTTLLCALGDWKSEIKTQRALCLEALVGLAPHEEELGKMNTLWSTTYTHEYCWIQVMGG